MNEFDEKFQERRVAGGRAVSGKKRVAHDATHAVRARVNHPIGCLDKVRMCPAREAYKELRKRRKVALSLIADFTKADRWLHAHQGDADRVHQRWRPHLFGGQG